MGCAARVMRIEGAEEERGCVYEGIVPDGVTSSQTDPLRNRSVLLLGSRELDFRTEGLVALW